MVVVGVNTCQTRKIFHNSTGCLVVFITIYCAKIQKNMRLFIHYHRICKIKRILGKSQKTMKAYFRQKKGFVHRILYRGQENQLQHLLNRGVFSNFPVNYQPLTANAMHLFPLQQQQLR